MRRALADLRFEVEYWLSDTFPMLSQRRRKLWGEQLRSEMTPPDVEARIVS